MKKMLLLIILCALINPLIVKANIVCNDGTISATCTYCHKGCCSKHGGCSNSYENKTTKKKTTKKTTTKKTTEITSKEVTTTTVPTTELTTTTTMPITEQATTTTTTTTTTTKKAIITTSDEEIEEDKNEDKFDINDVVSTISSTVVYAGIGYGLYKAYKKTRK